MRQTPLTVVVLAAGEGTRMKSSTGRPKVLHAFAGRSLLGHVLAAAEPLAADDTVVVVGHGREQVTAHLVEIAPHAHIAVQDEQLGTGHAVRVALDDLTAAGGSGTRATRRCAAARAPTRWPPCWPSTSPAARPPPC